VFVPLMSILMPTLLSFSFICAMLALTLASIVKTRRTELGYSKNFDIHLLSRVNVLQNVSL